MITFIHNGIMYSGPSAPPLASNAAAKWLAGPDFIRVKRGSQTSRAGGTHSGPHTARQLRALPGIMRALQATWRAKGGKRI